MMKETIVSHRRCPSCGKAKILSDENTGELFCGTWHDIGTPQRLDDINNRIQNDS